MDSSPASRASRLSPHRVLAAAVLSIEHPSFG